MILRIECSKRFRNMKMILALIIAAAFAVGLVLFAGSLAATADNGNLETARGSTAMNCSDGWRITGYFTPVEADYDSAEMTEIDIARFGKASFNADFLRVVFD